MCKITTYAREQKQTADQDGGPAWVGRGSNNLLLCIVTRDFTFGWIFSI